MSEISIVSTRLRQRDGQSESSGQSRRQAGLNDTLGWAIIVLLALVPLPFGSVHGFSWGFFAAYVGFAGAAYALALSLKGEPFRYSLGSMRGQVVLFCLFAGYLVLQILPIGLVLGPLHYAGAGVGEITGNSISVAADMTFLMLVRQLTYGVFFFLVLQVTQNDNRRRFLLDAALVIICAYATLAIVSLQTGDTVLGIGKTAYLGSATGPFVNRNSFATLLAFGAALALAQVARRVADQLDRHPHDGVVPGNISTIIIYGIAYLLLITVTFATQSRMGLFAALAGSAVVAMVFILRAVRSRTALVATVTAILVSALAGILLFGETMFDRVLDIERSAGGRTDLYAQVLELIGMRPLTGFGGGAFELAYPLVHAAPVSTAYNWDKAHNTYLTLWSELGLIAGSLPMILLALVGFQLVRSLWRRNNVSWMSQTVALAVLILSALHSLVDFSLEIQANTFMFLALIAAGLSAARSTADGT